jgi:hypothetical protein
LTFLIVIFAFVLFYICRVGLYFIIIFSKHDVTWNIRPTFANSQSFGCTRYFSCRYYSICMLTWKTKVSAYTEMRVSWISFSEEVNSQAFTSTFIMAAKEPRNIYGLIKERYSIMKCLFLGWVSCDWWNLYIIINVVYENCNAMNYVHIKFMWFE